MRILVAWATCGAVVLSGLTGCSGSSHSGRTYGAQSARTGESLAVLGWNMSVSNLRWSGDYVLIDVDASPTDPHAPHAKPEDIRFGLYGALAHPMESAALGSCGDAMAHVRDVVSPLSAPAGRLTGTVCLGPLKERSAVRGVYTYSPRDRIQVLPRPIRPRFRWGCCRPIKTTPVWWSRPPASRLGAPTACSWVSPSSEISGVHR